jgi:DNA primase
MKGKTKWVDFQKLKEQISMEMILEHYGLLDELTRKGDKLTGKCPLHEGSNPNQFSASLSKNAYQCFSGHCGAKGNILDFVSKKEGVGVREAALKIAEWFSVESERPKKSPGPAKDGKKDNLPEKKQNQPLTFGLRNVDSGHEYLRTRGISRETAEHFGVGYYDGKGMMKGRIVIPIHSKNGELVAYAGRVVDDDTISETNPRYRLPEGFLKSMEIFNLHRVSKAGDRATLVEGFFGVLKLHELGITDGIAIMGSFMSPEQEELIAERFGCVTVMMDGDEAGRKAQEDIVKKLSRRLFVRVIELPDGMQPDRLTENPF